MRRFMWRRRQRATGHIWDWKKLPKTSSKEEFWPCLNICVARVRSCWVEVPATNTLTTTRKDTFPKPTYPKAAATMSPAKSGWNARSKNAWSTGAIYLKNPPSRPKGFPRKIKHPQITQITQISGSCFGLGQEVRTSQLPRFAFRQAPTTIERLCRPKGVVHLADVPEP